MRPGIAIVRIKTMGSFTGNRWPGAIIPYTISPNFTEISTLNSALSSIESATNLRFVNRQPVQHDFIEVVNHSAQCRSLVGRNGGKQTIGCAPFGFGVGSLIHEFCHAAGMIHEHQRSDRNSFVRIIRANILAGMGHNFTIKENSRNRSAYDYNSIMHYGPNAFNNGTIPTIQALGTGVTIGGMGVLTASDIQALNVEYPNLGVVRRSDSSQGAGIIRELAVSQFMEFSDRLITAVQTSSGNLKLIEWRIHSRGGVQRVADSGSAAGDATHIDIARAQSQNRFITACRTSNGRLKLISWSAGGTITRLGDSGNAAGDATLNRIVAITNTIFVSACRTESGNLLLISWRLNSDGSITRLSDSSNAAGTVSEISLIYLRSSGSNHQIATTVKTSSGRLKVIIWNVLSNGAITRLGDSGSAIEIGSRICSAVTLGGFLAISCKTEGGVGFLKIIIFSVSPNGKTVTRQGDSGSLAGSIGRNALMTRPYGVISAVSTASGTLKLIKWQVSNSGVVTRFGDSGNEAGRVGLIALSTTGIPDAPIVTPLETGSNALDVLSWDDLSSTGELQR